MLFAQLEHKYKGNEQIFKGGNPVKHHQNMPIYVDPLQPHFYIVKLGFTGVYIISYFCSKT